MKTTDRPNLVRFSLEVESMRHQVMHAMVSHHSDIQAMVDEATAQYLDSPVWVSKIHDYVQAAINSEMERAVKAAVSDAMSPWNETGVGKEVRRTLSEYLSPKGRDEP